MVHPSDRVRLVITVPRRLKQELERFAKEQDRTLAAECRTALRLFCGIRHATPPAWADTADQDHDS